MRSTTIHAAWFVYVSVCSRVTSVSHAKMTESIEMPFGYGLVRPKEPSWYHMGPGSSTRKALLGEIVILGHTQTCNACGGYYQPYSQSGSSDVASGYGFHSNLFILLF